MGKTVQIFAWCDPHGQAAGVQATHLDVPLQWNKVTVTLDLCDQHFKDADEFLLSLTRAGTRQGQVNPGGGVTRGRQPKAYYDALQALAAERGITLTRNGGKINYPDSLRAELARRSAAPTPE